MTTSFDPYHQWLGIRPEEHPVDHYRLLGLVRFESDRDVISNACDRLMSHVRTFQTGPRGVHTQEVLTRLAAARGCLLDIGAKSTYDAVLHGQIAAEASSYARRDVPIARGQQPPPAATLLPPPPALPPSPAPLSAPPLARESQWETARAVGPRLGATSEIEYVDPPAAAFLQPWFPVLLVAIVLLVALAVGGLGLMLARARNQQPPPPSDNAPPVSMQPPVSSDPVETEIDETTLTLPDADGQLHFSAATAVVEGNPRIAELGGTPVISDIASAEDRIRWPFRVEQPGPFRIEATYSTPPGSAGGTFTLTVGQHTTKPIAVRNTGEPGTFTTERVGFLWVRRAGQHELVLSPVSLAGGPSLMTLQSLRLVPVGGSR